MWTQHEIDEQEEERLARLSAVAIRNPTTLKPDFILTSAPKRGGAKTMDAREASDDAALEDSDRIGDRGKPKKAKRRASTPTAASIDRQGKRLDAAREETRLAAAEEETAKKAAETIAKMEQQIKNDRKDIANLKTKGAKAKAKAKAHRAKAAKLAKG